MRRSDGKNPLEAEKPAIDLVFHFIDPEVEIELEDGFFDDESKKEVLKTIKDIKRSIWIDKTYVGFDDSKYSDVFLTVDGWKTLCEMLVLSRFGQLLPASAQENVVDAYTIMLLCYMYGELKKYGLDYEHVKVKPKVTEDINVEIYVDETRHNSYLDYKGRWQDIEDPEGAREQAEERKKRRATEEQDFGDDASSLDFS